LFKHADKSLWWPLLRLWLQNDPFFAPLICNSINVTILRGGQAGNVIPARSEAWLDVRLLPGVEPQAFLAALRSIISDTTIAVQVESMSPNPSPTPADTPFYSALYQTIRELDPQAQVAPYLTPGATDSRFFRAAGMKAYGFMPVLLTDGELGRIHGIDERISIENLRRGIQLVFETLKRL
jgi:acetylornithine deacetylase/succinyl-diaminopimelate desuccinylase-like protein